MMENIETMARVEGEIEKRMEAACGKAGLKVDVTTRVAELAA